MDRLPSKPVFSQGLVPSADEVQSMFGASPWSLTSGQRASIAREVYPGQPFDTELPPHFLAELVSAGCADAAGAFVWAMSSFAAPARPLCLVREAGSMIPRRLLDASSSF